MTERAPTCSWLGPEEGWHTPDGRPCAEGHCGLRGRCPNHVQNAAGLITCASCIGRTRREIRAIVDLHELTHEEAEHAGIESEALNLVGPHATAEQVDGRQRYADAERGWCDFPRRRAATDAAPDVFGFWDKALREDFDRQTDLLFTIPRARDLFESLLAGEFPHTREFEEFVADLARCRTHYEAVLHDSRKPEQGRPCPRCAEIAGHAPRLQKRYAKHPTSGHDWRRGIDGEPVCRTCVGENDTWHCPHEPGHWWSEYDYRDGVHAGYVEHASELPARELAERIGVSLSTVRKWCAREFDASAGEWIEPRLVSVRKVGGRKVYPVRAALALATTTTSAVVARETEEG